MRGIPGAGRRVPHRGSGRLWAADGERGGGLDAGGERGAGGDEEEGALATFGNDLDIKFDATWYSVLLGLLVVTVGPLLYLMFGPAQVFGDMADIVPMLGAGRAG